MSTGTPAVFLDRDGTLIEEAGYLDSLHRMRLFPWTVDALRLLARGGYRLVVITNQGGIALGLFDEAFVLETHAALDAQLCAGGARMDGYYYCPHHPADFRAGAETECACRKPAPGLVQRAASDLDLDLSRSFMIGDRWGDVRLADTAGLRGGILLRTGYGATAERQPHPDVVPAFVADDLMEATAWLLRLDR